MIVAIDPGFTGAVALVDDVLLREVESLPLNFDDMKRVDGVVLGQLLVEWQQAYGVTRAIVERVSSRPNQGVVSTFNFGLSFGIIIGVLDVLGFEIQFVRPQDWKKHFNLSTDKTASRALATDMWPDLVHEFARVKDDGKAEAALIGVFGEQC